jgi:flagellar biosynthetic protein FlhB
VALALTLAAALDAGWRWWRYLRRHAMTRQEVLAEAREAELPAEVQAQVRARQEQAARGGVGASLQSGEGANAGPKTDPLPNPLPQAGEGANAGPKTDPLPNPLPQAGEGANAGPKTINEVIG